MAWKPDYITADALKAVLGITDTRDDDEIARAITAASRAIDHYCNRQFGQANTAVARYYTARWDRDLCRMVVDVDDLMTTDDLVVKVDGDGDDTYETTLTLGTDFFTHPRNAAADDRPWTQLVASRNAVNSFPCFESAVEVTAQWGWDEVPTEVTEAAVLQANRFFKRRTAPFGVAGSPEMGSELRLLERLDPDVGVTLAGVRRRWGAV